jgi:chemotaxis protein methyltransferase CheR
VTIAVSPANGLPVLSDREFTLFQQLIHREAGIWLADIKRALLVGRLSRRLRELGLASFEAYYERVVEQPAEQVRMLDAIATNETHFFRERAQFDLLADRICPRWEQDAAAGLRQRRLRIWSAACSTGEEPYSLAMQLHDRLGALGWSIDILASDLSTKVLDHARTGVWRMDKTRGIPEEYLHRYLLRGVGPEEGRARVGPLLRGMVRFARINLREPSWDVGHGFDAVFCRNVLIYFDGPSRLDILSRMLGHIVPGGYLFLGHAESLLGLSDRARTVMPAVYQTEVS